MGRNSFVHTLEKGLPRFCAKKGRPPALHADVSVGVGSNSSKAGYRQQMGVPLQVHEYVCHRRRKHPSGAGWMELVLAATLFLISRTSTGAKSLVRPVAVIPPVGFNAAHRMRVNNGVRIQVALPGISSVARTHPAGPTLLERDKRHKPEEWPEGPPFEEQARRSATWLSIPYPRSCPVKCS
ncbi:hypothetical protein B0I37DRAFT_352660 [Chaetomium sp. MPI-CAGE-AT-0009]|nr:hypothetical protein B0I37DRAFT_352660 [Chaetomium sp. MPI-CAGE-AT-0009]